MMSRQRYKVNQLVLANMSTRYYSIKGIGVVSDYTSKQYAPYRVRMICPLFRNQKTMLLTRETPLLFRCIYCYNRCFRSSQKGVISWGPHLVIFEPKPTFRRFSHGTIRLDQHLCNLFL